MKFLKYFVFLLFFCFLSELVHSQVLRRNKDKETAVAKDSVATKPPVDTVAKAVVIPADTTKQKTDTVREKPRTDTTVLAVSKNCFQDWYEKMRERGAKQVTDGIHPVIITLKSEDGNVCLVGQIEVLNGKLKAPLMVQQEDGEFKPFNAIGKKLDPVFVTTMTEDQLLGITDGMSILFRTTTQEYGRIIFYTFANKSSKANKTAPNPDDLLKDN
jgi:hypothetical protein